MFVFLSFQTSLVVWQMNSRSLIHLNKYTLKVIWWYVHSTFPNKQPCIFGYQITKTIRWKIILVMSLYLSSILFVNYLIFHSFDWKQIRTKSPLCFDAWNLIRKLQILVRKCSYFFCVLLFREGRGKNYIMKKQLWSFSCTRLSD